MIPALAECDNLFATLATLATNPPELLARFLVLVVVNHREDAPDADKADNRRTLARLAAASADFSALNLAWIDAASPSLELPIKGGGVGLARKIGLDLALGRLDHDASPALLVCLDADTLVEPSYLPALVRHFRENGAGGAAIPFHHQRGGSPDEQHAIDRYELFLRHYVLGLQLARSPYAFHTVGSAMACTTAAYARSGGMNTRTAGEDFYFLQHLSRTDGVAQLKGTTVHPSPRPSHRVPFGTGRSVSRWLGGDGGAITFYQPACFRILGEWLNLMGQRVGADAAEVMADARKISPHLAEYLDGIHFPETWSGLCRNNPVPERLHPAFNGWFDGLKTMKLVHHLSSRAFTRCEPDDAVPELLRMAGEAPAIGVGELLELLRQRENG
ncbi:MAG TPA: glycosyltransferase family 2 protein [Geobacteraceae bacterium]|nr:glycosyltransferase family 2 protein [Geobacteraceae bacterium]